MIKIVLKIYNVYQSKYMAKFFPILINSTMINRTKIFDKLDNDNNYYLLKGAKTTTRKFSDVENHFRQNSNFFG